MLVRTNCGKFMILTGILVLVPIFGLPFYPVDLIYCKDFLYPAIISILLGCVLCFLPLRQSKSSEPMSSMDSNKIVLFAWFWGILLGAVPFITGGQLKTIDAIFEAVSGWTTTGLSVMDVSITPMIYLFHRSFMQFCGGLGFVLMMVMLIQGKTSMNLFNAEGHPDKLKPNLKKTAQTICIMYLSCLVIGTVAYYIVGMPVFDGICHSMCALSTGGFSTKLNSIGEYHSFAIELVTIALMIIGTTNFAVLLLAAKGKWKQVFKVSEIRFMLGIIIIFVPLTGIILWQGLDLSFGEGLSMSLFNIISAISTSGFSTMSYSAWPPAALGIMILLMLIGGGIGSTAGGLKLTRVYLVLRIGIINMKKRITGSKNIERSYYIKAQGKTPIDDHVIMDTFGFFVCYLIIFVIGSIAITLTSQCDLTSGMFEFASSLGTVGLSIGLTAPGTNAATLIVEMVGMILGRLEIFIILTSICYGFKKLGHTLLDSEE